LASLPCRRAGVPRSINVLSGRSRGRAGLIKLDPIGTVMESSATAEATRDDAF